MSPSARAQSVRMASSSREGLSVRRTRIVRALTAAAMVGPLHRRRRRHRSHRHRALHHPHHPPYRHHLGGRSSAAPIYPPSFRFLPTINPNASVIRHGKVSIAASQHVQAAAVIMAPV